MNVTHYLNIYPRDSNYPNFNCLCDYNSGMSIISIITKSEPDVRFFITFNEMFNNVDIFDGSQDAPGLVRDKTCYYSPSKVTPIKSVMYNIADKDYYA